MNVNPACSAVSERLCFYGRWRIEELLIHFLSFQVLFSRQVELDQAL